MSLKELASIRHVPTRIRRYVEYASSNNPHNPTEAQRAATEALKLAELQRSKELIALSTRTLGLSFYYARSYAAAIEHLERALKLYEKLRDHNAAGRTWQNLGVCYLRLGQHEAAMAAYLKSSELFRKSQDNTNRALVLINLAVVYTTLNNKFKAFETYSECLELLELHNDEAGIAAVSGNLGQMFMEMGENDKGLQWMERSLEMHRKAQSARGEAFALREIGSLNQRIGKFHEAQQFFNSALKIYSDSNDLAGQAQVRILIAELFERAQFAELKDARNIARSYTVSGRIYSSLHKAALAVKAYEQALVNIQKTDNYAEHAGYHLSLAEALFRSKKEKEAQTHLMNALDLSEKHDILHTQVQTHRLYSELYERRQDLRKALRHVRKAQDAQSRLEQQMTSRKVQDLKYRVDIAKVERDRELIRQQSEQYRAQLESKSKDLNASALSLAQKNEVISALKQRIQSLSRSGSEANPESLRELLRMIEEHLRGDKQMEGVTKQLSDFHQDFLHKLSAEFKNLTPTEIKICSLLKLNLNTKEIADFLCVSFKSVEVYRARIRKKLGLGEGENLSAFIVGYDAPKVTTTKSGRPT